MIYHRPHPQHDLAERHDRVIPLPVLLKKNRSSSNCQLLSPDTRGLCVANRTFGCVISGGEEHVWVSDKCYGRFLCGRSPQTELTCSWPGNAAPYLCKCGPSFGALYVPPDRIYDGAVMHGFGDGPAFLGASPSCMQEWSNQTASADECPAREFAQHLRFDSGQPDFLRFDIRKSPGGQRFERLLSALNKRHKELGSETEGGNKEATGFLPEKQLYALAASAAGVRHICEVTPQCDLKPASYLPLSLSSLRGCKRLTRRVPLLACCDRLVSMEATAHCSGCRLIRPRE